MKTETVERGTWKVESGRWKVERVAGKTNKADVDANDSAADADIMRRVQAYYAYLSHFSELHWAKFVFEISADSIIL